MFHRRVQRGDDASERTDDPWGLGLHTRLAVRAKAHPQTAGCRGAVERRDVDRINGEPGVGSDRAPDCLAEGNRVLQVGRVNGVRAAHEAPCNQPGLERVWVGELLRTVLQVDGVDESLDEADVAGSGFAVSHDCEYIHNLHLMNIGYNNWRTAKIGYGGIRDARVLQRGRRVRALEGPAAGDGERPPDRRLHV